MFDLQSYLRVLLSITAGLLTLLGTAGIFISLFIQRKIERLQDILEEFMDLSYQEDINLTGKMFKLIEKYQMHYIVPDAPSKTLTTYVNLTVSIVAISWLGILFVSFEPPFKIVSLVYLFPIVGGFAVLIYYRRLIKNVVNPINNWLLSPIIPPPTALRSVSYLSKYVNVSVKSILKQARLSIVLRFDEDFKSASDIEAEVILKEELSLDDFYYYFYLAYEDKPHFVSFGEIHCSFPPDQITKKPVPVQRNINISLGYVKTSFAEKKELLGQLFIFPKEEKHPVQYTYYLSVEDKVVRPKKSPEIKINHLVVYRVSQEKILILENKDKIPLVEELSPLFTLNNKKRFLSEIPNNPKTYQSLLKTVNKDAYIS